MTHTTVGGTGTVDQVGWAKLWELATTRFRVDDPAGWAPSVVAGVDRTVRLTAGPAEACGVLDTTDTTYDLQCTANGTASDRYDLIVATWTWSVSGCTVAFEIIQGTAGAGAPDASVLTRNPGAKYQAVIVLVKVRPSVGSFAGGDLTDMRVWGGSAGPLVTPQASNLHLIDGQPGYELIPLSTLVRYRHDGAAWQPQAKGAPIRWRTVPDATRPISSGGANESGITAGITALATFTLTQAARVQFDAIFRTGVAAANTGAALVFIKVNGTVMSMGTPQRSPDTATPCMAGVDLAAGTHTVSVRVEGFGGAVTWTNTSLTISEGVAE